MTAIQQQLASLAPDAEITLFIIDPTNIGAGGKVYGTTAGQNVSFGGQIYQHYSCQFNGFQQRDDGQVATPTVAIVPTAAIRTLIAQYEQGRGAVFQRIKTMARFLDSGSDPDTTQTYPVEYYFIERLATDDDSQIKWELSNVTDLEGYQFPLRRVLSNWCDYSYRTWNPATSAFVAGTCPFAGSSYYDRTDASTSQSLDNCGKRLSSCKVRYGASNVLPYRGFPGVSQIGGGT